MERFQEKQCANLRMAAISSADPLGDLRTFFLNIALANIRNHQNGCMIGSAVVEMSGNDDGLLAKGIGMLKDLQAIFVSILERAKTNGQLPRDFDTGVGGLQLVNLWNGLNITRRMYPEQQMLHKLISEQFRLLGLEV